MFIKANLDKFVCSTAHFLPPATPYYMVCTVPEEIINRFFIHSFLLSWSGALFHNISLLKVLQDSDAGYLS